MRLCYFLSSLSTTLLVLLPILFSLLFCPYCTTDSEFPTMDYILHKVAHSTHNQQTSSICLPNDSHIRSISLMHTIFPLPLCFSGRVNHANDIAFITNDYSNKSPSNPNPSFLQICCCCCWWCRWYIWCERNKQKRHGNPCTLSTQSEKKINCFRYSVDVASANVGYQFVDDFWFALGKIAHFTK